jgi:hypothetical protein
LIRAKAGINKINRNARSTHCFGNFGEGFSPFDPSFDYSDIKATFIVSNTPSMKDDDRITYLDC